MTDETSAFTGDPTVADPADGPPADPANSQPADPHSDVDGNDGDALSDAYEAMADTRRRLAEVPVEVVVTNHVMGLYELATIHLSADPPDLTAASLAIDAVGALVDGLGDRIGEEAATLRLALSNIRMVFVQFSGATAAARGDEPSTS